MAIKLNDNVPLVGLSDSFSEMFRGLREGAVDLGERLHKQLDAVVSAVRPRLDEFLDGLRPVLQQLEKIDWEKIAEVDWANAAYAKELADGMWFLNEVGWPPLMHASQDATSRIRHKYGQELRESDRRDVDSAIVRFYSEELIRKEILDAWKDNTFLAGRYGILRNAVEAHINGQYDLSVPTILPHIEGIIADSFNPEYLNWNKLKKLVEKMLSDNDPGLLKDTASEVYRELIVGRVLASFERGEPIPFELNRHAILHGADTNYGTAANSLKAILIVDFLIDYIPCVTLKNSHSFHIPNCGRIKHADSERRRYLTEEEAESEGLRPCKVCHP